MRWLLNASTKSSSTSAEPELLKVERLDSVSVINHDEDEEDKMDDLDLRLFGPERQQQDDKGEQKKNPQR